MIGQKNSTDIRPRVTLNSSGGIALGAFMAGVFFEIIKEALKEKKFVIDIITGASAGAMTGAVASYYLVQGKEVLSAFDKPEKNALYEAWVTKADIKKIDKIDSKIPEEIQIFNRDRDSFSLLSGKAIADIAELIKNHPAKINRPLALLMTVTNLQGFLYKNPNEESKSISSAEIRQFFFYPQLEKDKSFSRIWEKVIISSRISGAFPLAFPPIKDRSDPNSINFQYLSNDYFEEWSIISVPVLIKIKSYRLAFIVAEYKILKARLSSVKRNKKGKLKLEFSYSDGGILDNLPILKGIELVEKDLFNKYSYTSRNIYYDCFKQELYRRYPELNPTINSKPVKRFHVYVQPNPAVNLEQTPRLQQELFTLWQLISSGLRLPQKEHETIQIQEINEIQNQIENKKELLNDNKFKDYPKVKEALDRAIPYSSIDLSPITPLTINQIIFNETEEKKFSNLKPLYNTLIQHSSLIAEGLGATGNLPTPKKILASDFLNSFGGFFDRKYREHDFLIGRICGITWLQKELGIQIPQTTIKELIAEIKRGKILDEEPKLKPNDIIRLSRIALRFIRISLLEIPQKRETPPKRETQPKRIWVIFYYLFLLVPVLVLRILEGIATILVWITSFFEL